MKLSLFLNLLHKVCGNGDFQHTFTKTVLETLFDEENAKYRKKQFPNISPSVLTKVFNGSRELSVGNAKLIVTNLNRNGLEAYLNDLLTDDARSELCKVFQMHIGNTAEDDIAMKLSHKLADIIASIAYKKTAIEVAAIQSIVLDTDTINQELENIINKLTTLDPKVLNEFSNDLSYDPQTIDDKIPDQTETRVLKTEIKGYVASYFIAIQKLFQVPNNKKSLTFTQLELAIKAKSVKLFGQTNSHKQTFDNIADWVRGETHADYNACRMVVAFFVQNCEVFTI